MDGFKARLLEELTAKRGVNTLESIRLIDASDDLVVQGKLSTALDAVATVAEAIMARQQTMKGPLH